MSTPNKPDKRHSFASKCARLFAAITDRLGLGKLMISHNDIKKAIVYGLFLMLAALLQITFFSRFSPFNAVPDLMLASVTAIAFFEGAAAGGIAGIFAGFFVEALGSTGLSLLPLVYFLCAYTIGVCNAHYWKPSLISYLVYLSVFALIRATVTLICLLGFFTNAQISTALLHASIPEFASTMLLSPLPSLLVMFLSRKLRLRDNR